MESSTPRKEFHARVSLTMAVSKGEKPNYTNRQAGDGDRCLVAKRNRADVEKELTMKR